MSLRSLVVFVVLSSCSTLSFAADTHFRGINCKSDLTKLMQGRSFPNEAVNAIEAKHRDLSLESLGSNVIETSNDPINLSSWLVCGREYLLLEKKAVVRDVLASPFPNAEPQSEISRCVVDGRPDPRMVVWFTLDQNTEKTKLASQAWVVDDKKLKFVKLTAKVIQCESMR